MTDLRVIAPAGSDKILEEVTAQNFADSLGRRLVRSGDGGYHEPGKVWNDAIDRRPAPIAKCAGVANAFGR